MRTTSPSPPNPPFSFAFRSGGGRGDVALDTHPLPAGGAFACAAHRSLIFPMSFDSHLLSFGDILFFCVTFFCMCACDFFCIHFHFFFISFYFTPTIPHKFCIISILLSPASILFYISLSSNLFFNKTFGYCYVIRRGYFYIFI